MTTIALKGNETDSRRIAQAIRDLQRGRHNAHGSVTLNHDGAATETVVEAPNCSSDSHVSLAPTTANAAAQLTSGSMYWAAENGQFTITHGSTSNDDETFTWAVAG